MKEVSPGIQADMANMCRDKPVLEKLADKMLKKGKISKERRNFVVFGGPAELLYDNLKGEHPEINWVEWELHA